MSAKPQPSFLIGGAVLALGIWLLDALQHALGEWSVYVLFASGVGAVAWWMQQKSPSKSSSVAPQFVDATLVKRTLAEAEKMITQLGSEVENPEEPAFAVVKPQLSQLQSQIAKIMTEMSREQLRLAIVGGKGSGKTTLIQHLQSAWASSLTQSIIFQEAPGFAGGSGMGLTAEMTALQQAIAADLVLFLITGDLTESELRTLQTLMAHKRTLLVLNKQDQYLPEEQAIVLTRIQERTQALLRVDDVIAISAAPQALKVRQHQSDGSITEWLEEQPPSTAVLTDRLEHILQHESQQLVMASSLGNAVALKARAKTVLNDLRRTRALPVVEQFQWIAAATAFASPLPTLDVVATAAINVQMVMDLGAIYRQKFSLQQAQTVATTLGSVMLKLGLVELSTRAIVSLLKTNAVTYVAGGCIQGISAAYLTRVAGLSLIEYFQTQDPNLTLKEANPLAIERFSQILRSVFQQNQQLAFLQSFVGQAVERLPLVSSPTPLPTALPPTSLSTSVLPELGNLDQNESSIRLSIPSFDSTTVPSN